MRCSARVALHGLAAVSGGLLGYAGAFRRGELVALDVADLRFTEQGLVVHVRRSKTDQDGQGTLKHVPALSTPTLCAVAAVRTRRRARRWIP